MDNLAVHDSIHEVPATERPSKRKKKVRLFELNFQEKIPNIDREKQTDSLKNHTEQHAFQNAVEKKLDLLFEENLNPLEPCIEKTTDDIAATSSTSSIQHVSSMPVSQIMGHITVDGNGVTVFCDKNPDFEMELEQRIQECLMCIFDNEKIGKTRIKNIVHLLINGYVYSDSLQYRLQFKPYRRTTTTTGIKCKIKKKENETLSELPMPLAKGHVKRIYSELKAALSNYKDGYSRNQIIHIFTGFLQKALKNDLDIQKAVIDCGRFLKQEVVLKMGPISLKGIESGMGLSSAIAFIKWMLPDEKELKEQLSHQKNVKILNSFVWDPGNMGAHVDDLILDLIIRLMDLYDKKRVEKLLDDLSLLFKDFEDLQITGGLLFKKNEFNIEKVDSFCMKLEEILISLVQILENSSDHKLIELIENLFSAAINMIDPIMQATFEAEDAASNPKIGEMPERHADCIDPIFIQFWRPVFKAASNEFYMSISHLSSHFGFELRTPTS